MATHVAPSPVVTLVNITESNAKGFGTLLGFRRIRILDPNQFFDCIMGERDLAVGKELQPLRDDLDGERSLLAMQAVPKRANVSLRVQLRLIEVPAQIVRMADSEIFF